MSDTKIKLCGLSRVCDIDVVNEILPEFIGFVFWDKSKRQVSDELAKKLKKMLDSRIKAVGVFVDETPQRVAQLAESGTIDVIQLHGNEDDSYISELRKLTNKPVIKAFKISDITDIQNAENSSAEFIMADAGKGTGRRFDWSLLEALHRPYFLAGGLSLDNIAEAVNTLHPYAVDVSSGIETDGLKDKNKMREFVRIVRNGEK